MQVVIPAQALLWEAGLHVPRSLLCTQFSKNFMLLLRLTMHGLKRVLHVRMGGDSVVNKKFWEELIANFPLIRH
jgi:hypothetical protein